VKRALGIFALALLPRMYAAIAWAREPVWDGHYYDIGARSIAAGRGYVGVEGGAWCHYPVGYPALLGLFYRLCGSGALVAPLVNAALGALTAALVYLLAQRVEVADGDGSRETRALAAGVLTALHPGLVAYTPLVMTEPTAALLLVAAAWAAARAAEDPSRRSRLALAALLFGLGTLVRPQTILCAPAAALFFPDTARRARLAIAAATTALALAVVAPWTVRNCLTMDGCAFVSTNGGWNLAIGSFPRATGRFETLHGSDGCTVVTGQVQQDRCWQTRAIEWIVADPAHWIALAPKKLGFTFDHESFAVGYLGEADPQRWPEEKKERGRWLLSFAHRVLMVAAPLAFVARPSRSRPVALLGTLFVALLAWIGAAGDVHTFWPLALAIPALALARPGAPPRSAVLSFAAWAVATLVIVHVLFFGEDRYHLVVAPLLCLLAASSWRKERAATAP
jgi:hypothetical protein